MALWYSIFDLVLKSVIFICGDTQFQVLCFFVFLKKQREKIIIVRLNLSWPFKRTLLIG